MTSLGGRADFGIKAKSIVINHNWAINHLINNKTRLNKRYQTAAVCQVWYQSLSEP